MKNKFFKRSIIGLLAVSMLFTLTACKGGSKEPQKTKMSEEDKNAIYSYETIEFKEGNEEELGSFIVAGDHFYATRFRYDDETYESTRIFCKFDLEGNEQQLFEVKEGYDDESSYGYQSFVVSEAGDIYTVKYIYGSHVDESSGEYSYEEEYYLIKMDETGKELWEIPLGEDREKSSEEYYYVDYLKLDSNGNVWVFDTKSCTSYDKDGNKCVSADVLENINSIYPMKDGNFMVGQWNDDWTSLNFHKMNTKTGELSTEVYETPGSYYSYNYVAGLKGKYDMYATSSLGVYAFNWGDTQMVKIMDYILSDVDISSLYQIEVLGEDRLLGIYYDLDWNNKVATFKKVPANQVEDKYIMTLACHYLDTDIRKKVVEFNRSHEDVRITVNDYSMYRTDDNYDEGINKLNSDLLAGNVPDIIIAPQEVDLGVYISKGIFADLYEFMNRDESFHKEDYLTNILALGEQDGKLYELIPYFEVITFIGKTANVGEGFGWTYDDVNHLLEAKGEDVHLTPADETRESILNTAMNIGFHQFYNSSTGECHFNSEAFIQFLELMNRYPEEIPQEFYDDDEYWSEYDSQWRDDRTMLSYNWIYDFAGYMEQKVGYFGEDISYVGFPTSDGSCGSAAYANFTLAIAEEGSFKEEAWEFVKTFIGDEYQDGIEGGFPIKLSALEKKAEKEMKVETYIDEETGAVVESNNWLWINGQEIEIPRPSNEDCQYIMDLLKQINHRRSYDDDIAVIIQEESAAYFAGEKSAKEVSDIIQSRVSIYVNEKR